MTIAELYYGAEKSNEPSKNMDTIEKLLLSLEIVHTDISILKRFGMIKAYLQKHGEPIADADILIASSTLEKADKLITGNTRHFERIAGLALENWG
jgi:tRNA(fMet)-specific endonuclease VapC